MKNFIPLSLIALSLISCSATSSSSLSHAVSSSNSSQSADISSSSEETIEEDYHPEGYELAWSDEFDGTSLSKENWQYEIGGSGWGNNELQYYTDHNETVEDGLLTIHAKKEDTPMEGGQTRHYTSSRLVTRDKQIFTYGYMCARIRLPLGQGMWPAFWMMPQNNYGEEGHTWWPTGGEIDIMEARGRVPSIASGALHYSADGPKTGRHLYQDRSYTFGEPIDEFHVYAVKWTDEFITWIYDGDPFFSLNRTSWNRGYETNDDAPFNRDFYFILNLAVGGNYDGGLAPKDDFVEAEMNVDYVRCYQEA